MRALVATAVKQAIETCLPLDEEQQQKEARRRG